jgi:hypothetical protein
MCLSWVVFLTSCGAVDLLDEGPIEWIDDSNVQHQQVNLGYGLGILAPTSWKITPFNTENKERVIEGCEERKAVFNPMPVGGNSQSYEPATYTGFSLRLFNKACDLPPQKQDLRRYYSVDNAVKPSRISEAASKVGRVTLFEDDYSVCAGCSTDVELVALIKLDKPKDPNFDVAMISFQIGADRREEAESRLRSFIAALENVS